MCSLSNMDSLRFPRNQVLSADLNHITGLTCINLVYHADREVVCHCMHVHMNISNTMVN